MGTTQHGSPARLDEQAAVVDNKVFYVEQNLFSRGKYFLKSKHLSYFCLFVCVLLHSGTGKNVQFQYCLTQERTLVWILSHQESLCQVLQLAINFNFIPSSLPTPSCFFNSTVYVVDNLVSHFNHWRGLYAQIGSPGDPLILLFQPYHLPENQPLLPVTWRVWLLEGIGMANESHRDVFPFHCIHQFTSSHFLVFLFKGQVLSADFLC